MSINEIVLIIESNNEKIQNDFKTQIAINYAQAQDIAIAILTRYSNKKVPTLYESYPDLFSDLQPQTEGQTQAWMLYKEQMLDFANQHNRKRGEKNK